jgi:hypothetical protein
MTIMVHQNCKCHYFLNFLRKHGRCCFLTYRLKLFLSNDWYLQTYIPLKNDDEEFEPQLGLVFSYLEHVVNKAFMFVTGATEVWEIIHHNLNEDITCPIEI